MCSFEPGQRVWVLRKYNIRTRTVTSVYTGEVLKLTLDGKFFLIQTGCGHLIIASQKEMFMTDPREHQCGIP